MMRRFSFILWLFAAFLKLNAQQFPVTDQYLFNPVSVSPAFTGKDIMVRGFVSHRSDWTSIPGSPVNGFFTADGTIARNMGLGLNLMLSKAGIYRNFCFSLTYAYHVRLAKEHILSFAISPSVYQNAISFDGIVVADPDDPMIAERDGLSEVYLNAGFSLLYNWKDLNFSIAFPILFNNRSFYNDDEYKNLLSMDRNWLVFLDYTLRLPSDFALQFDLLYRKTSFSPWTLDFATTVKYRDAYRLGLLYRKGNIFGISAGVKIIKSIAINYTYEFSGQAMMGKNGGNHEISLGYLLKGKGMDLIRDKAPQLKDYYK